MNCRMVISGGVQLVPPVGGETRLHELGSLRPQNILLDGTTWKFSSIDIAIAGIKCSLDLS